jgi:hypothetical protein
VDLFYESYRRFNPAAKVYRIALVLDYHRPYFSYPLAYRRDAIAETFPKIV